jgi:CHAT domain-containing protein
VERTRRTRFSGENRLPVTSKFDANAFQRKLKTNEVLIEYGVLDDELFACVVRNDRIHVVRRVATWGRVVAAIEKAQFQLESMRYGVGALAQQADRLSQRFNEAMVQLSDLLWTPFVPLLKECKRIAVVPHAVLGEVQFAALFENGRVLGEKYEIAIAPSARAISYAIDNPPIAPRNILALAENTYLDEAENEAAEIAQLFTSAEVLVNERATSAELKRLSSKADVLHIACHASFRSDNPTFSSLHLADAPFSARDAESLSLERCLVTLSACETGRFQESRGDEMMGIVRGFLVAGATCVVASLWSVDDAVTRAFMTTFYRELISGANPARALQEAQATIRATHPHPFYWGAFSLFGGW